MLNFSPRAHGQLRAPIFCESFGWAPHVLPKLTTSNVVSLASHVTFLDRALLSTSSKAPRLSSRCANPGMSTSAAKGTRHYYDYPWWNTFGAFHLHPGEGILPLFLLGGNTPLSRRALLKPGVRIASNYWQCQLSAPPKRGRQHRRPQAVLHTAHTLQGELLLRQFASGGVSGAAFATPQVFASNTWHRS